MPSYEIDSDVLIFAGCQGLHFTVFGFVFCHLCTLQKKMNCYDFC